MSGQSNRRSTRGRKSNTDNASGAKPPARSRSEVLHQRGARKTAAIAAVAPPASGPTSSSVTSQDRTGGTSDARPSANEALSPIHVNQFISLLSEEDRVGFLAWMNKSSVAQQAGFQTPRASSPLMPATPVSLPKGNAKRTLASSEIDFDGEGPSEKQGEDVPDRIGDDDEDLSMLSEDGLDPVTDDAHATEDQEPLVKKRRISKRFSPYTVPDESALKSVDDVSADGSVDVPQASKDESGAGPVANQSDEPKPSTSGSSSFIVCEVYEHFKGTDVLDDLLQYDATNLYPLKWHMSAAENPSLVDPSELKMWKPDMRQLVRLLNSTGTKDFANAARCDPRWFHVQPSGKGGKIVNKIGTGTPALFWLIIPIQEEYVGNVGRSMGQSGFSIRGVKGIGLSFEFNRFMALLVTLPIYDGTIEFNTRPGGSESPPVNKSRGSRFAQLKRNNSSTFLEYGDMIPIYDGRDMSEVQPNSPDFRLSSLMSFEGNLKETISMVEFTTNMWIKQNGSSQISLNIKSVTVLVT
ncbi:hypothetical protein PUNSTDRAFT_136207 [Punctularia strigosozonata HHB-11173 SS5]|uniref:uncharacterized protein n=1 Tax=Punctularia strigosozonata (strain HHB-11173) TaxID=741275 RepID=UPI00044184E6|nr:uncharacterized protein PUNSTDRAFT_136207 [Punctularia strigosozonata HHB-11173 SS5]EIN07532.1 hypothetical protein PUNSTDRAFT_136207 [Punctularia strigosozonata HHB-11173 SS5]